MVSEGFHLLDAQLHEPPYRSERKAPLAISRTLAVPSKDLSSLIL